ncbi:hypothetical protein C7E18_21380 [Stenotrophomonas maltophilia]|nr:hypothetical protein C7E18_21380 [Stenotrophomonas maltophilia]
MPALVATRSPRSVRGDEVGAMGSCSCTPALPGLQTVTVVRSLSFAMHLTGAGGHAVATIRSGG